MNYFASLAFVTTLGIALAGSGNVTEKINLARASLEEINRVQIATAIEMYYIDHSQYPSARNSRELLLILQKEKYIENQPSDPDIFVYRLANDGQTYKFFISGNQEPKTSNFVKLQ